MGGGWVGNIHSWREKKKGQEKPSKKPRLFLGEKTLRKCTYFFFAKKKMFSKKKKAKKKKKSQEWI